MTETVDCPIEAVFGSGDENRYPCTYANGHEPPHSFAGPNPPSAADLARGPTTVTKGDVITIVPERGPSRRMLVAHVKHHIITLADLEPVTTGTRDNGGQS